MKKTFSLLFFFLILCCVASCYPQGNTPTTGGTTTEPPTDQATPAEDFEYEFDSDGKVIYISKYIGTSDAVTIPSKIEGYPVVFLKGIVEDGIVSQGAFENCAIKTIVMPDSVVSIGVDAFKNCEQLTSVSISKQCKTISNGAFQNCLMLEKIDLSQTQTEAIGMRAFEGCSALSEIKFPDSLLTIERRAFYDCSSIAELSLPKNLTTIRVEAFFNCTSLKKVTIPAKLDLTAYESAVFYNLPSLEKIVFDEGREEISGYAFFATTTNVEIIIPKSVKLFSSYPFFSKGPVTFVFLGDCPELGEKKDFYGEPCIYYDPTANGWENCSWKEQFPLIPIA